MFRIASDPTRVRGLMVLALCALAAWPLAAQEPRILSHEVSISRTEAELELELDNGRSHIFAVRGGRAYADGRELGPAPRGGDLDRAWRELLSRAIDLSDAELSSALIAWSPSDGPAASALDQALELGLAGQEPTTLPAVDPAAGGAHASDTVARLLERIEMLEEQLEDEEFGAFDRAEFERELRHELRDELRRELRSEWRGGWFFNPLRYVGRGLMGILSVLATYAVLGAIGIAVVFFGRKYVEAVADTVRHATLRSGLVGFASLFLSLPAWILGIIALAISIIGIPLLLGWIPLFWLAVFFAGLMGYIAVAHAAGEALAERRLQMGDWFKYGNSYYYVLTGLGLLLVLFLAAHAVRMAGPWLGWLHGMLVAFGVILTVVATAIGVGAVVLSRAGTRPLAPEPLTGDTPIDDVFEEETRV